MCATTAGETSHPRATSSSTSVRMYAAPLGFPEETRRARATKRCDGLDVAAGRLDSLWRVLDGSLKIREGMIDL